MIRAVLYDLDGTLVDSEDDNGEALTRVLARHGRRATDDDRAFVVGHSWNEIHARLSRDHALALPIGQLIDEAAVEREALIREHGVRALPGACDVPRRLSSRFLQTVVSGSSRREVELMLRRLGLADVFSWFVASEDYRAGKPSPEPYETARARLGVSAIECLAVEDTRDGIRAAHAAGMRVVAVRAGKRPDEDQGEADHVVETLLGLEELVARLA